MLQADSLLISEFMAQNDTVLPDGDGQFSDWIELHNPTGQTVDLQGWHLTDDAAEPTRWRFPSGTISPGEHLLVFASGKYPDGPPGELHTNFKLSGDGEYLALLRPDGLTVEFAYEPAYPQQYDDVSFGLSPDFSTQGFFTNPTPGAPNVGQPVEDPTSHVLISEIMYHPQSEDVREEYIELMNLGVRDVDLAGWQFDNGVEFTFPGVTLSPGAYLVVAADQAAFAAKYPQVTNFTGGWTGRLRDSGETIELIDSRGNRVDRVRYADQGDWGVRQVGPTHVRHEGWIWTAEHDGLGKSLELINPLLPNEHGQNWAASAPEQGTPGEANSVADADVAPMVLDVAHRPIIPRSTDPVTITARIADELASELTVTLLARLDGTPDFGAAAMRDDGLSGDGLPGDGVYAAMIPPRPDGSVMEFYVQAADGAGNLRTLPGPTQPSGEQLANFLYQVDNAYDPNVPWDPDGQPVYRLIMTEAERAELEQIGAGGDSGSDAQFNGTFVYVDGTDFQFRYNVGIRNRGNGSRRNPPNNYRVNFVHDRPWRDVTRVNLNARYPYLQSFASAMFRMAGLASADASAIQTRVNGVDLARTGAVQHGSYAHLEVLDGDFVDAHFPDDNRGNLYKVFGAGELEYRGQDPDSYRNHYFKHTNEDLDDWSDLIELTNVLNDAPEETYIEELSRVVNVDQWLRYLALDALLGNLEGGLTTGRGDDFAIYRGVEDTRFVLVPHDLDTVMGQGNTAANPNRSIFVYDGVTGLRRMLNHPQVRPRYYAAFVELIDTFYNPQTLNPLLDHLLGGYVPQGRINQMKQFVVDRTAGVLGQIPRQLTAASDLPVVDGFPRTDAAAAILEGTADAVRARSVLVGGLPTEWDARTGEWQVGTDTSQAEVIFPQGSQWSYLQDGSDQGTAWREVDFAPDPPWAAGDGVLGLEGSALPAPINTPLELGATTYYFRKSFDYQGDPQTAILRLTTLIDDGVVVYLNGAEVFRLGVDDGPVTFETLANRGVGNAVFEGPFSVPNDALVQGPNVIAAELHQRSVGSSDIVFDLELEEVHPISVVGVPLLPGINRIPVEVFDGPVTPDGGGSGNLIQQTYVDIWRNTPTEEVVPGGPITQDRVLSPEQGPYRVTGDVVVEAGATLTILPGTTVFFEPGTSLVVRGRLLAEGTEHEQIRLTRVPGGGTFGGVQLQDTMQDNRISHAVLEYGVTDNGLLGVERSRLLVDQVTFDHTDRRRIRTVDSSLIVRNSTFTDLFAPGQQPTTEELSEHIWGSAPTSVGGWLIIENNRFGTVAGNNDAVDLVGNSRPKSQRQGPVIQVRDNQFLGSGDDLLELGGDALVEGNTFSSVHKDQFNSGSSEANAITAAGGHELVVVRNVFYDVDHVAAVTDGAFVIMENNTVADVSLSALCFEHPAEPSEPGRGAYLDGNIFFNTPVLLDGLSPTTQVAIDRSIVPGEYLGYGRDNIDQDPRLADPAGGDFRLLPGSPALFPDDNGSGLGGLDMGAMVPAGASISGEPPAVTGRTSATLTIGGPGVTHYKARFGQGAWTPELPVVTPLELNNLGDGEYSFSVIGKDFAGVWQDVAEAAVSKTWTVDTSLAGVRINEVLAVNSSALDHQGTFPDLIELVNQGTQPVDVAGMSISDDPADPRDFVFPDHVPAETTIPPGGYLVLYADGQTQLPGLHLGFSLDGDGEGVYLYAPSVDGGGLLDSVEFGVQVADLSIGRVGHQRDWGLSQPTFGAANRAARTGDPAGLRINEWLANGRVLFDDDFVELFNPDPLPVAIGGLYLTDRPAAVLPGQPPPSSVWEEHRIAPLSYVAGGGWAAFPADGNLEAGPHHLGFRLAADQELIGLYDGRLGLIDQVIYHHQTTDVSQGRSPDGAEDFALFRLPTPGVANPVSDTLAVVSVPIDTVWSYDQSGVELGTDWRQVGFDDTLWPTGPALLYVEGSPLPAPKNTQLTIGDPHVTTYYFRTQFRLDADPDRITDLSISTVVDDGAVVYLNGEEVWRLAMPGGEVTYETFSNRHVGNAAYEGPFAIPTTALRPDDNLIAVEVHQENDTSGDVVFGLTLDATATSLQEQSIAEGLELIDGLRITEIMYHPAGDADTDNEFIELQNTGDRTLNLEGVRLGGGVDFTFPPLWLPPQQYVVVVGDREAFEARYGPGIYVAGRYDGNLSNGGEELLLRLASPLRAAVLRFEYDDAWYPTTDGVGFALEIRDPAAESATWDDAGSWQAGTIAGGTPGSADGQPIRNVLVNEVLTHTDPPEVDAIELFNPTAGEIDLGGWYLSDSRTDLKKFRIRDGTRIPGGGYLVFDESDFNPTPENPGPGDFALNGAHGDDVWLLEADAEGNPVRVADHVEFPAAAAGESFGRWPSGAGPLYPMVRPTLDKLHPEDGLNSGPRVGPVIISELHYNPSPAANDDDLEFVEILNPTDETVELAGWRLGRGIEFDFAAGTQLAPGGVLVVVPFELGEPGKLAAFRAAYGVGEWVAIVGGYTDRLGDGGQKVQLQRPDGPPADEPWFIPRLIEDEVIYDDDPPWPAAADGGGSSLARLDVQGWGNHSGSWAAQTPTPGRVGTAAQVVGRYVFYSNSAFDGNGPAPGPEDDDAIAPDKQPLLPGGTATFANYTGYDRGVNGIIVDVMGLPAGGTLAADDFRFRVGNDDNPDGWAAAADPGSITIRPGQGFGGSDRVTLIFADNTVQKQWLQVTVLANAQTGLDRPDVFYFGNAIGETGNSALETKVNAVDMLGARDNQRNFLDPAPIDFDFDFNRDTKVNTVDMLIARNNQTHFLNALRLITVPPGKAAGLQTGYSETGQGETPPLRLDWLHQYELPVARHASDRQAADEVLAFWA